MNIALPPRSDITIVKYVLSHLGTSRVVEMSWLLNKNVLGILNKYILSTVVLEESVTTLVETQLVAQNTTRF